MANDTNSLAYTRWNCKYHIVFAPKYRRKIIYGECKSAKCPDHIHMLIEIPPKESVTGFMGFLTGKSSILN